MFAIIIIEHQPLLFLCLDSIKTSKELIIIRENDRYSQTFYISIIITDPLAIYLSLNIVIYSHSFDDLNQLLSIIIRLLVECLKSI